MVTMRDFLKCLGITIVIVFNVIHGCDTPRPSMLAKQPIFKFERPVPTTRIDMNEADEGQPHSVRISARRNSVPLRRGSLPRRNSDSVNLELVAIIREEIGRRNEEERAASRRTATEITTRRTENRVKIIAAVGTAVVSVIGAIGTLIYHFNECGK